MKKNLSLLVKLSAFCLYLTSLMLFFAPFLSLTVSLLGNSVTTYYRGTEIAFFKTDGGAELNFSNVNGTNVLTLLSWIFTLVVTVGICCLVLVEFLGKGRNVKVMRYAPLGLACLGVLAAVFSFVTVPACGLADTNYGIGAGAVLSGLCALFGSSALVYSALLKK